MNSATNQPDPIAAALAALPAGPLTEAGVAEHLAPLFSRVLARNEVYLANHSLGRPLDRMADDVRHALDLWYADMDSAWGPWLDATDRYRALVAQLIGCVRTDAVVPKTAAGQGLRAVLNALPTDAPKVLTSAAEFDSIDHILSMYHARGRAHVTRVPPRDDGLMHVDEVIAAISPELDLIVVSQVIFATGQVVEGLDKLIAAAHRAGVLVLIDTYHSAGVMPVRFDELGPDFAIGGNYKYTRGGPGACWLAIHPRHLTDDPAPPLRTLDTGWFAKREPFAYDRPDTPDLAAGGNAWLESTPPILTAYQALAGLEFTLGVGVDRLAAYNREQQATLESFLSDHGVPLHSISPRGAYLLVPHDDAPAASATLKERGVNTDARRDATGQGFVRLCPDVLTTTAELEKAARVVAELTPAHRS
ncbi:MAG: aminotransferase class V-fold PLP-dependent enzyme [Planctomycetota bacterium]